MSFITEALAKLFGKPMIRKYSGSIIRHLLTVAAGALAAGGLPEISEQLEEISPQLTELGVGLSVFLFGLLLSFKDKSERE